jgi:hypothetical protein
MIRTVFITLIAALCSAVRAEPPATAPTADDVLLAAAEPTLTRFLAAISHSDVDAAVAEVDPAALAERTFGAEELKHTGAAEAAEVTATFARQFADILCGARMEIRKSSRPRAVSVAVDALVADVDIESTNYAPQTLRVSMRRTGGRWRVADVGDPRDDSICAMLGKTFAKEKGRGVTPKQFVEKHGVTLKASAVPPRATTTTAPAVPLARHDTSNYATAADAVRAYVELLRAGRIEEAVDTFWDANLMLEKMFERDYVAMVEEDRLVCAQLVRRNLVKILSIERAFYPKSKLEEVTARQRSDETTDVAIRLRAGDYELTPRLIMTRGPDGWKIFDLRAKGGSLVDDVRRPYERVQPPTTPLRFLIAMVEDPPPAKP